MTRRDEERMPGMDAIKTDVLVIGAGSGGLSVAAGAAQMGADVTLLEGGEMGGDCLNYGCVPSKALIASAARAQAMRDAGAFGIAPVVPVADYAAIMARVRDVIAAIAPVDSQSRFEGLGCRVIRDWGRFVAADTVEAGGRRIRARRIVIATGSSPAIPPVEGLEGVPYLTNETLWDLTEAPGHLLILGGGPIGVELAQAHRRLGCEVTVIERGTIMGKDDPELVAVVRDRLEAEGVTIREGADVVRVSGRAGAITVHAEGDDIAGTHLLVASGRRPNVARLDLAAAGIDHDPDRGIAVGDDLRTTNHRVYAVGDVAGRMQFTHVAGYHGATVIRPILLGLPAKVRQDHLPWVTYTDPELAQVGLTEAAARDAHGDRLSVLRVPYGRNDRAEAEGATEGLIKVMAVGGRPVGVSIVGKGAGDLIGLWALVLANRLKLKAVTNMVAPYPTLGELSKTAAGQHFAPMLFENIWLKRVVRLIQRLVP